MSSLRTPAFCLLALAACSSPNPNPGPWEDELEILYGAQFEPETVDLAGYLAVQEEYGVRVWPLAGKQPICVIDPNSALDEFVPDVSPRIFVRLQGRTSQPGSFGHLNTCVRMFAVTEIIEQRWLTSDEESELETSELEYVPRGAP